MFTPYTGFSNFFTVCCYLGIHAVMEGLHEFLPALNMRSKTNFMSTWTR